MKKFIAGLLVGIILMSAFPISAAIQEYNLRKSTVKLIVDDKEIVSEKIPLLYMSPGYNYLPAATFREICEKLGVGFEWVADTNSIEIKTKEVVPETVPEPTQPTQPIEEVKMSYNIGDLVEFTNCKIKVNSFRYDTKLGTIVPKQGSKYGIVNLDVVTTKLRDTGDYTYINYFIDGYTLNDNTYHTTNLIAVDFRVYIDTLKTSNVALELPENKTIISITIKDPVSKETVIIPISN